ncbi:MAG: AMP-binding protein [Pseudomonadota bacterium]
MKVSSVDFVEKVFDCYEQRELFMIDGVGAASNADLLSNPMETIEPAAGGGWFDRQMNVIHEDTAAQIIFSSGTEGRAKAFVITHASLANVVDRINGAMAVDDSIREYIGIPVTFSFGLARCRAVAAAGGRGFIPSEGFNVREIKTMLDDGEINAISAVPSLWRVLLSNADLFRTNGKCIRWIEIGSQYMSAEEKRELMSLFPQATIVQHYGLTEASRSTLLHFRNTDDAHLESVGDVLRDNIDIALDEVGRIRIRGAHVAAGRIVDGALLPIVDDDGWLTTNDLGSIKDGYLYYGGRYDDIVNCGGIKVDPDSLQQRVSERLGGPLPIAITGVPDKLRGEAFFVAVASTTVDAESVRTAVNDELVALGVNAGDAIHVQTVDDIPVTDTGKIQRKRVGELFEPPQRVSATSDDATPLVNAFREVFADPSIDGDASFTSLGGDSLNFVQLSISVERILGYLPDDWEHMSIEALENGAKTSGSRWAKLETSVLLRSTAIFCIVLSHSGWKLVGGGTFLLFLLIGANFARFQFREFSEGRIWQMLPKYCLNILIPYYCGAILFGFQQDYFSPYLWALIQNFWGVGYTILFPFWFVQVLLQCLFVIALFLSIKPLLRRLRNTPWLTSFCILLVLLAIRFSYPLVWDTSNSYDLVAPRFIVYIWLGWTIHLAYTGWQRFLMAAVGVAFAVADNTQLNLTLWLSLGCVLLPAIRHVYVPRWFKWASSYIAAATFYIFIFNGYTIYLMTDVLGIDNFFLNAIAAFAVSFALWAFFERLSIVNRLYDFVRHQPVVRKVFPIRD